jgi:CBS domain-containing protein
MTRDVVAVDPEMPVREAARILAERGFTSLPVVDPDGHLVGIVTEADILRERLPDDPRSHLRPVADPPDPPGSVGDVLSSTVICLGPAADIADAAAVMSESNIRAIPVVDGGRLIGIVSRRDLLRTLIRDDDDVRADVQQRLDAYAGEPGRWKAHVEDGVVTIHGRVSDDRERDLICALARTVPGVLRVHVRGHGLVR